jgi:hypothetical protein
MHGGKGHHEPKSRGKGYQFLDDTLRGITVNFTATAVAEDVPNPGVEEPEVVGGFGGSSDGRSTRAVPGLACHGDRGGDPVDVLRIGLLQTLEELSGVGGETLDIAPLTFRVERIERETAFPAAAQSAEDDELPVWDVEIDSLKIMDFNTA